MSDTQATSQPITEATSTATTTTTGAEIPNPKFKTALCKNYINSTCNRQNGCHFAHGSKELRAVSENSSFFEEVEKPTVDYLNKWPTNIPTNYKTTLCQFYEQVGTCKYDQNCNFAHGEQEKRQLPENIQSQLKTSRNTSKHINNSSGQKNTQQIIAQQMAQEQSLMQYYTMIFLLNQQHATIIEFCTRIEKDNDSTEDNKDNKQAANSYVQKTINDIKKMAQEGKLKQALQQLKKLCSRKDATQFQQDMLVEIVNYMQNSENTANPNPAAK